MGATSIWHWLILGIIVILLFGGSRFSNMMGDVAKGIKNFKKGLAEEEAQNREATRIEGQRAPDAQPTAARDADPVRDERA